MKERLDEKIALQKKEVPVFKKDNAAVTSDRYKSPKTIPLIFHFLARPFLSASLRLEDCDIQHESIEGKDVYIFDNFFIENESEELRNFTKKGAFKRTIFAEHKSREKGEEPARAMDNKEKWQFFSHPPQAMKEIFKLLSFFSEKLDVDITTLPWEMYDENICAPAFATNLITNLSKESEDLGKHDDYNTEEGISFGIPILYSKDKEFHPSRFVNGETSKPWLVTIMLYATSEDFLPEFGLGSVFCKTDGKIALRLPCKNMRFVLFEGDIVHGIAKSDIPKEINPWRVSYVLKLVFNPRKQGESPKKKFFTLIEKYL